MASYILKIITPIVLWKLWRSRCSSKFDTEKASILRSKSLITYKIHQLIKAKFKGIHTNEKWENIYLIFGKRLVEYNSTMVKWICPPAPLLKLNTDGSCIEGNCGGGAEASALLFGLKWCIDNGMNQIVAGTDSLLLQNTINGIWTTSWRIEETIRDIKSLVGLHGITTTHCYREANKVADKLVSIGHSLESLKIYL
ncbi:hypothetical protein R3W88_019389 [Solanum pinnatisectum]|uniref:RNase H type-1 domain-containing protein n=1 Tax=Solanum pinnatisectum TaxID=50273 RepID=A0AAV9KJD7_9SOLN|nr:hypothetical protein R3W88_019389 [Solanum pinnatisectum]